MTQAPLSPPPSPSAPLGVIVVGSGLAGLSAASQLVAHNIPVHILERQSKPGGNSIKASSGINGVPTKFQPVPDTVDEFYADTLKSAGSVLSTMRERRETLIHTLTSSSASAVEWLTGEKGIDLSRVAQLGGHSKPRTHRGAGKLPPGAAIVSTLLTSLKENPLVQIETDAQVTRVLKNNGTVVGVQYFHNSSEGPKMLRGPVIFASGGFAGDAEGMLAKYRPDLAGFPSTNEALSGSQRLLTDIGARLLDMKEVQVHPTGFVDPKEPEKKTKFLAAEMLRGEGGMLIQAGKRFINELDTRQAVADAIMNAPAVQQNPKQWDVQIVMDEGAYEAAKSHVDFYLWKGLMRKTTVSELCPGAISAIQQFAFAAYGTHPDPFGRKYFGNWSLEHVEPDSVVYIGKVTPVTHFTMGGVIFNERGEVLDADEKPIKGLWAAGEVTGGIHGVNRLGGSSLLECAVFGRIAGDQAAGYYQAIVRK